MVVNLEAMKECCPWRWWQKHRINWKQPWYHSSALLFVASWKMTNEVIQKIKIFHILFHWLWHCFGKNFFERSCKSLDILSLLKIDFLPKLCKCAVMSQLVNAWQKSRCQCIPLQLNWLCHECCNSLFCLCCFESTYSLCKHRFCCLNSISDDVNVGKNIGIVC